MKIKQFLAIAMMALTLTSCLDNDNNDNEISKSFTYDQCFAVVENLITNEKTVVLKPKVTVNMVSSKSKFTGQITLTNFQLPDMPNYTFELPETAVSERTSDDIMWIESGIMRPTNLTDGLVAFNNVKMGILQLGYMLNNNVISMNYYTLHFEYNGKYRVDVYPLSQPLYARTNVVFDADPTQTFNTTETKYTLNFDPETLKCSIDVKGAKFVSDMPSMDMTFPNIPFTSQNGSLKIETAGLTPTIRGVEFPQFPITNLSTVFTPLQNATLNFSCNPAEKGLYNVEAALQYSSIK